MKHSRIVKFLDQQPRSLANWSRDLFEFDQDIWGNFNSSNEVGFANFKKASHSNYNHKTIRLSQRFTWFTNILQWRKSLPSQDKTGLQTHQCGWPLTAFLVQGQAGWVGGEIDYQWHSYLTKNKNHCWCWKSYETASAHPWTPPQFNSLQLYFLYLNNFHHSLS